MSEPSPTSSSPDRAAPFTGSAVAMVTPFTEDGAAVDLDVVHQLVGLHAHGGTSTLVPCGTTGETPTLSASEYDDVVREVISAASSTNMRVLVGTGSNSTSQTVRLTAGAAEAGADGCLVVCPYYNRPSQAGLLAHFRELDRVGVPLVVYNIPGRTGVNMLPATLEALVSECDNIVGLKASNGDLNEITNTAHRMARTGRPFSILSGDDSLTIPIMSVGGQGVISVAANLMPVVMANLVHGYSEGRDNARSAAMMRAIHGLCVALLQVESNPGPIKALMREAGLPVGPCRLPLFGVTTDQTRHLMSLVDAALAALKDIGAPLDDSLLRLADGSGDT